MIRKFGQLPTSVPPGYFKAVRFPVLAMLDKATGDNRLLESAGADTRTLPLSIRAQFKVDMGHFGADLTGTLFEVTIDPENGVMSGQGFLLNDEFGRRHARAIHLGAMQGNSVDLAEVKARIDGDPWSDDGDYTVVFTEFKLAATTGVGTPAFAQAYAEVDPLTDDELMASLVGDDPMEPLEVTADWFVNLERTPSQMPTPEELTASGAIIQQFADFYVPEASKPQKYVVTADRKVYGHLGLWNTCHDGIEGQCLMIPRPTDNYASFNKPGPLTERGQVQTGPIFLYGGHRSLLGAKTVDEAYGGIENTWADVRVTEGVFGPWISGVVRPGVTEEMLYAARASRLSGHWLRSQGLKAMVCVNAEGYEVPGDDELDRELAAGFAFRLDSDGEVAELVASFPGCVDGSPQTESAVSLSQADREAIVSAVLAEMESRQIPGEVELTVMLEAAADSIEVPEDLASRRALAQLLLDDDEDDVTVG